MLPNFLICGVQKAATTSLHAYLRQHPQVFMPETKELNFFSHHWDKGLDWYEQHFQPRSNQIAVGEASPLYAWDENAPARIRQTLKDPRLIFLLRNPIDRAYSNYLFNVARAAQRPEQSFSEAIRTPEGQWRYLDKGLYSQQLSRFAEIFPRERMYVGFTETLRAQPDQELRQYFAFLDVDPLIQVDTRRNHNATRLPRNATTSWIWGLWVEHRQWARRLVPGVLAANSRTARRRIHSWLFHDKSPPPMNPLDRTYLRDWFADDTVRLERFLDKSLPWQGDWPYRP